MKKHEATGTGSDSAEQPRKRKKSRANKQKAPRNFVNGYPRNADEFAADPYTQGLAKVAEDAGQLVLDYLFAHETDLGKPPAKRNLHICYNLRLMAVGLILMQLQLDNPRCMDELLANVMEANTGIRPARNVLEMMQDLAQNGVVNFLIEKPEQPSEPDDTAFFDNHTEISE